MNLTSLQPGQTIDLHGQLAVVPHSLVVPPGSVTVCNGRLQFTGNGGKTGDGGMSIFQTNPHSGQLHLENVRCELPANCSVVHTDTAGRIWMRNGSQSAGCWAWCNGADIVQIDNWFSEGTPDKYGICNFSKLLKVLRVNLSGTLTPARQGKNEAWIRLMSVDDALVTGLKGVGSRFKQFMQSRPGGMPARNGQPRDHFARHVWQGCTVVGCGAAFCFDGGNFKDPADVNFPFGTLGLLRLDGCDFDGFELTTQGANALTWDQMGIQRVEIASTKLGGKLTNQVLTH